MSFDAKHPGLRARVDAMLDAFISPLTIRNMLEAEYGEHIAAVSVWRYRRRHWVVARERVLGERVARVAWEELKREGKS